jgi:DNA-binding transcriptional MocR family regulator
MTIWIPDLTKYAGPRYKALATAIASGIDDGELIAQQKLPPQRQLADALGVTLGTVTRGYAEAERRGLVSARVGSGTYVNEKGAKVRDEFLIPDPREGFIDLTVSLPVRLGQQELLAETLGQLQHDPDTLAHMLEYHPDGGFEHHRQVIAKWISYGNFAPHPDSITLCNGGQHAIQLALIAACRPGDTILAEGLAYPGLKSIARQLSLKVIPIPMDEQGIVLDSIADLCRQYNPRLIYCTPTQHNPTNVQMTLQRRQQLISVADECQLLIIEDDVSASLVQNRPEPLASMSPDRVFYISICS